MSAAAEMELKHALLTDMLRIRRMEEKCAELYGLGKIRGFLHLYIGQEAVATGALHALSPEDNVVATYREHGHALVRGVSMNAIMAEMYGKREGCSHGRGGSMHLFDAKTHFYGGNAIVAAGIPIAVGLALADKMQNRPRVSACFFGDGAMAEGAFHESMNLAALWQLPVLFLCENNYYAMGTALDRYESQPDLCTKAASYNMPTASIDGMDVMAVHQAVIQAVAQVRAGGGPQFIEFRTYRFRAHSMYDPELYRNRSEVEEWKQRDPIDLMVAHLKEVGMLTDDAFGVMVASADEAVRQAVAFAEAGSWEPVEDMCRHVYTEGEPR